MAKYCVNREEINTSLIRLVFLGKKNTKTSHTHTKKLNNFPAMDFTGVLAPTDFLNSVRYSAQLPYNKLRSSPSGTKRLALNS